MCPFDAKSQILYYVTSCYDFKELKLLKNKYIELFSYLKDYGNLDKYPLCRYTLEDLDFAIHLCDVWLIMLRRYH